MMKSTQIFFSFFFLLSCIGLVAQSDIYQYENSRIYPGQVTQSEVFIVNSPLSQNTLFASCNTLNFIPFFVSEGIYTSTDGGQSWAGNDTCAGNPADFHGGDPGIAIDKDGTFILTRLGRAPFTGLYSHYSTDNGNTWSSQKVISTDDLERASVATDYFPTSPNYGRTYAVWVKFAPPFPIMISHTDDGGVNWSDPVAINNPPNRSAGGDICIGPGGEVYVCWAGVTDVSPFKEIHVGFARSENGGMAWMVDEQAFPANGITGILEEKGNIRVNGLPGIAVDTTSGTNHGKIYIVSGQKELLPAGSDPDIILNYSNDKGSSWSDPIRVNQDAVDNGKIQYFPSVHIDSFGGVDIIFYDDRNTSPDSSGVFLARSVDAGATWKEYEISDHNFKPAPIGGLGQGYQGDNIDLTSTSEKLIPVWMDNSTGIYQVWTAGIDFSTLNNIISAPANYPGFELKQNYPNPFREKTCIEYSLTETAMVQISVFSMSGIKRIIVHQALMGAGVHRLEFKPDKPGMYLLSISVEGNTLNRKMLCLP